MSERIIEIVIKGKNLTSVDFAAARKELRALEQGQKDVSASSVSMGQAFKGSFTMVAAAGTAAVAAIGAVAFAVNELGQRGSTVADVVDQFDVLNRSIGNNAASLRTTLARAMAGTITDFDLMRATNQGLSQGLQLSEDQFGLTAKAARVLADRIGGDSKTAYEALTMAMATGQDKTLKGIGLNIDAAGAAEQHAASLNKQVSELTEAEKTTATRNAILVEMQRVLAQSGEAEVDFTDRVDQAKTILANFVDTQAESIARSPVLAAGMDAIGRAFMGAFGPKQGQLVDLVTAGVNRLAMMAVDAGIIFVEIGRTGYQAFGLLQVPIRAIGVALTYMAERAAASVATIAELAASVPGVGRGFQGAATAARLVADGLSSVHAASQRSLADAFDLASGHGKVDQTLQRVSSALATAKSEMAAASLTQREHTKTVAASIPVTLAAEAAHTQRTKAQIKADRDAEASAKKFAASVQRLDTAEFFVEFKKGVDEVSFELEELPSSARISTTALAEFKKGVSDTGTAVDGFGTRIREGLAGVLESIPQTLAQAFQGGGNFMGAVKSIGSQIGSTLGGNIGAFFGGPLGKMAGKALGSLVGPLIGRIGSLFTSKNTAEVRAYNVEIGKVRDSLMATHGPLAELERKAQSVGLSFRENWGHQGAAGLEAMKRLAEEFTRRWDELNKSIATTRGELDGLIQRGTDMGFEFDAQGNLVRVNFEKMSEAAQRYGIDIGSLGETFQAQRLHASAEEIINDFELLTRGGADVGGVLAGMKDEINALVKDSIKFGTDIPENMRPWIEELIRTGQLTDENGGKITDLAGLQFGESIATQFETISTQLKEVVTKLGELIAQLSQSLTPALDNAMRDRTAHFRFDVDEPPDVDWGGGPGGGFARGTFGRLGVDFPDFGSGREVIVHGREAIVPFEARESTARRWLGQAAGVAAAASITVAAPNVYIVNDFSGSRQVTESEFRQVQSRLNSGELQVPQRAITQRGR